MLTFLKENRTVKSFILKTIIISIMGLVLIGAHAASKAYTERIAVKELSETFMVNCIPDDGGRALVKNEAGNVTCEKHEMLHYGQAPQAGMLAATSWRPRSSADIGRPNR